MMAQVQSRANICFRCQKAICGCSWSREFVPVDGWTAEPVILKGFGKDVPSYHITACPEFVEDEPRTPEKNELLARKIMERL